jgi:signal transduction histidine kinase
VTEVGLPPENVHALWASWTSPQRLEDRYGPAIASMLYAGESAQLDAQHLPEHSRYTLVGAQSVSIMPMRLGEELVGVLLVDYPEPEHDYSRQEEIVLTSTLAQLGALVLERDRLLRGWAETRANELALYDTKAQMDTFLGIASHELKTPLTSLKLSLQMSQRQLLKLTRGRQAAEVSGEEAGLHSAVEQLGRTAHQMQRMEALVNDLVDVSRIQAGKLELRPEHTDLVAVVQEAVAVQQDAQPERIICFQPPPDQPVPVYADAGRIEQVVTNYLTNALKYSLASCPVDVGVEIEPEQARVWVRDHGPGLPASEQAQIWERFHRVQGVEVQSGAGVGLGLGLYISRMIVERHQGQVGVQSAPGQGATFWFTVPLSDSSDESP